MIRLLTAQDSESLRNLRLETLKNDPEAWYSKYEVEREFSVSDFTNRILYSNSPVFGYYGYFENGTLLGYLQLNSNYWAKKKHVALISDVYVSPTKRQAGIGSALMRTAIEKAKEVSGIEQIELWVNSENKNAASFYEKLGFKKVAEIPESLKEDDGRYQSEYVYLMKL